MFYAWILVQCTALNIDFDVLSLERNMEKVEILIHCATDVCKVNAKLPSVFASVKSEVGICILVFFESS